MAVQRQRVFADSKTFVDCVPRGEPAAIMAAYRAVCGETGFDLVAFVQCHFEVPHVAPAKYVAVAGQSMAAHIDGLWPVLTRVPRANPRHGSLLPLPHDYVVPGGRFTELYYWDSYFTMLGLAASGCHALVEAMTDNFAYLIDTFGRVPNGTRTYYLSRSQPPVFALMARLSERHGGPPMRDYLPQLRREHAFWMDGADALQPGQAHRRVVMLDDGAVLNRYWDDRCTPREESWREDVATASLSDRPPAQVYRDLRAAAESGWDFSSRWLDEAAAGAPDARLATIRTTCLLPVDLNALLHKLETEIAALSREAGDEAEADAFDARAARRWGAMDRLLWDPRQGAYFDYDWQLRRPRRALTGATVVPLFTGSALTAQARAVAATVRARLLAPGGFATTEVASGEQWDRPNGWAPLQWMAVQGLQDHGFALLAGDIRSRWLATTHEVYLREHKLVEKYTLREAAAEPARGGGGGEYPLQDGFGWSNGVTRQWLGAGVEL